MTYGLSPLLDRGSQNRSHRGVFSSLSLCPILQILAVGESQLRLGCRLPGEPSRKLPGRYQRHNIWWSYQAATRGTVKWSYQAATRSTIYWSFHHHHHHHHHFLSIRKIKTRESQILWPGTIIPTSFQLGVLPH